jgi:hypothetical protein
MAEKKISSITVIPEKRAGDLTGLAQLILECGDQVTIDRITHRNLTNLLKDCYLTLKKIETLDVADQFHK